VQLPLITVKWFMCVFVNTLRPEVALRVWDMFLNEGSKVLFRIAAALFQLNESKLLAAKDPGDLFNLLRNMGKDILDADVLIQLAYNGFSPKPMLDKISPPPSSPSILQKTRIGGVGFVRSLTAGTTSDLANPRLKNRQMNQGTVPADLIGIGLAHIGPESATATAATTSTSTSAGESSSADSSPVPFDANSRANSGLSSGGEGDNTGTDTGTGAEVVNERSRTPIDFPTDLNPLTTSRPAVVTVRENGFSLTTRDSVDERPRPSQQELLDLQVSADQLTYQNYISQNPHKLSGGERKPSAQRMRRKVLNFRRSDLALWRTSFRPALEERHRAMEEARREWRSESGVEPYDVPGANGALSAITTKYDDLNDEEEGRGGSISSSIRRSAALASPRSSLGGAGAGTEALPRTSSSGSARVSRPSITVLSLEAEMAKTLANAKLAAASP
jgi:hypothetical protein